MPIMMPRLFASGVAVPIVPRLIWPRRLGHIAIGANAGAGARHIRAKHGVGVGVGAGLESLLRSLLVLLL
eukprot:CAMPEP_0175756698 /NCGR_PEP_ID=MMETSP0097-20121207/64077_1 /TAXON_ID=311494 /ORGANISM="Alexandrium monilatum, Strain CCMP3105" /LENGTH=69 /DNA_ID=CAMNT_0017065847 /DNA_START=240 /DNA_END=445 /DNA_ORIENTATION=-